MTIRHTFFACLLAACGTTPAEKGTDTGDTDTGGDTDIAVAVVGSCAYVNGITSAPECKEYVGTNWSVDDATADCETDSFAAKDGAFSADVACSDEGVIATCVIDGGTDDEVILHFPGEDDSVCGGLEIGCGFSQGELVSDVCGDGGPDTPGAVFQPFVQECLDPVNGEAAGEGPDGKVCTYSGISACTEEGRRFDDYASCDAVLTQRPYSAFRPNRPTDADDPRFDDADWVVEYEWATKQVESCACICCHSEASAPNGETSDWWLETEGVWTDTLDDDGLAMLAGWVDSTSFGAVPPDENNGFDRETTGLPTTDISRMAAFLEGELARRDLEEADFANTPPFGGPLYDQLFGFSPEACEASQGIASDGTISWTGGGARYVYVLEQDAANPGVPPNLDTPAGTIWRLDVAPDADPVDSGIDYGSTPTGTSQAVPATGAAPELKAGTTYYLYVARDVYQPITRCLTSF